MAARSSSNSAASTGKRPQKTTGIAGRKPGSISVTGLRSSVIVSPIAGVGDFLDGGGDEADLARPERFGRGQLRGEHADALDIVGRAGAHHADAVALLEDAVDDPHQHHDAEIGVVPGVDEERLERRARDRLGAAAGG